MHSPQASSTPTCAVPKAAVRAPRNPGGRLPRHAAAAAPHTIETWRFLHPAWGPALSNRDQHARNNDGVDRVSLCHPELHLEQPN